MAIFHGRYSWDGKKTNNRDPISWFPGAYDLTITNIAKSAESIAYIRPYLCIFTNTEKKYSVSANPEKFAKRICEDFNLQIEKVLWVEQAESGSDRFEVVTFQRRGQMGDNVFYSIAKRAPMDNELSLIKRELEQSTH